MATPHLFGGLGRRQPAQTAGALVAGRMGVPSRRTAQKSGSKSARASLRAKSLLQPKCPAGTLRAAAVARGGEAVRGGSQRAEGTLGQPWTRDADRRAGTRRAWCLGARRGDGRPTARTGARQRSVEERRALDASWNGPRRRSRAPRRGRQKRWPAAVAPSAPGGRGGSRGTVEALERGRRGSAGLVGVRGALAARRTGAWAGCSDRRPARTGARAATGSRGERQRWNKSSC